MLPNSNRILYFALVFHYENKGENMDFTKLYIGGQWISSNTNYYINVINPYTDEVIAKVPETTNDEILLAIKEANIAKQIWEDTPFLDRIEILSNALEIFKNSATDVVNVLVDELGSPIKWANKIQLGSAIYEFSEHLKMSKIFKFEEKCNTYTLYKEPIGVVAAICPWNYPLYQAVLKVVPALLTGNTIILKPSSETPLSSYYLVDAFHRAGLPKGVLNFITGSGSRVGATLAGSKDVDMVSFTGSTEVGRSIAQLAGQNINKVVLELGGKSPCLVLEDADLNMTAKVVMNSCFLNTGQTCSALTRLFVPRHLRDELVGKIKQNIDAYKGANPRMDNVKVGTLVSKQQKKIVMNYAMSAVSEGATLAVGDILTSDDALFEPLVFTDVTNDMKIAQEEIFGPVLAVIDYDDVDEAIRQCNDTEYGLAAAVMGSEDRAFDIAKKIKAGNVSINNSRAEFGAPFGGYKKSGIGRESGMYGLDEYVEVKAIIKYNLED